MINVKLITPDGLYKELEANCINASTTDGWRGILPNHMPIVLMLNISRLEIVTKEGKKQFAIGGGMLYFENNVATILIDSIESQDEIDIDRANSSLQRAKDRIDGKLEPKFDMKRAEAALKRAMNRIHVSSYK